MKRNGSVRVNTCFWCKAQFWSGKEGVISPIAHLWFCTNQHYHQWWMEYQKEEACQKSGDPIK